MVGERREGKVKEALKGGERGREASDVHDVSTPLGPHTWNTLPPAVRNIDSHPSVLSSHICYTSVTSVTRRLLDTTSTSIIYYAALLLSNLLTL